MTENKNAEKSFKSAVVSGWAKAFSQTKCAKCTLSNKILPFLNSIFKYVLDLGVVETGCGK